MDLSVVIVNWNTRDLLRACLLSLRVAVAASSLRTETIVVDNASSDGSATMVESEFPDVGLIANRENRNYAAGNNQGLREARGELILLLNPDTEVPPDLLSALAAFMQERPRAAAVAPALIYPDGTLQPSVRGFPTPKALAGELTGLGRLFRDEEWRAYRVQELPGDRPTEVDQPMASAFLLRKTALDEVGLFDEGFPLFFNDVDLCFRLKQAGWGIWYDPSVRVVHVGGASTRQVRPDAIRLSHAGLRRFYRVHYRSRLPIVVYAAIQGAISLAGWIRATVARLRQKNGKARR